MYKRFEGLLKKNNVKVADVTRATGIASSTFTDWKKGRYEPKADKMQKIADYFGVPLEYLTKGEVAPKDTRPLRQTEIDDKLLELFGSLNNDAKYEAFKRVAEMTRIALHKDMTIAAHNDADMTDEEFAKMLEDVEDILKDSK